MKKLFAYAAIALFGTGALILSTHSFAKSGGFAGGFKGHWAFAKPHFAPHAAPPHHFAFAHGFAHRHRFARDFGFGLPYADFDTPYAEPQIIEVPQEANDDVPGSTGPRRVSVWRGNSPGGACSVENVTVPSSQGGDATVRVIRC